MPHVGIYQEDEQISSDTEKDEVWLNDRTAGTCIQSFPKPVQNYVTS